LPVVLTSGGTLEELVSRGRCHGDWVDVLGLPWAGERMLELIAVILGGCSVQRDWP